MGPHSVNLARPAIDLVGEEAVTPLRFWRSRQDRRHTWLITSDRGNRVKPARPQAPAHLLEVLAFWLMLPWILPATLVPLVRQALIVLRC